MDFGYSAPAKQEELVAPIEKSTSVVAEKEVTKIEPVTPRTKLGVGKSNSTKILKVQRHVFFMRYFCAFFTVGKSLYGFFHFFRVI